MHILILAILSLIVVIAIVVVIGLLLPTEHVVSMTATYRRSPEAIWNLLADVERYPTWRSGLDRVEILPERGMNMTWREIGRFGAVTMEQVESVACRRLVVRIADTGLAFGGRWIYRIEPSDEGGRLTITEEGEVYNPVFRFLSRFVFGHTTTIRDCLISLGRAFDEETLPVEVQAIGHGRARSPGTEE